MTFLSTRLLRALSGSVLVGLGGPAAADGRGFFRAAPGPVAAEDNLSTGGTRAKAKVLPPLKSGPVAVEVLPVMKTHGETDGPHGFVSLCGRDPSVCEAPGPAAAKRMEATPALLAELNGVNVLVNRHISPATDLDVYGVTERWVRLVAEVKASMAHGAPLPRGDCEDYAETKQGLLEEKGIFTEIAVVRDEDNEGHAVLVARTTAGDFVLDNKTDALLLWNRTPYHYLMRQGATNHKVWMALDPALNEDKAILAARAEAAPEGGSPAPLALPAAPGEWEISPDARRGAPARADRGAALADPKELAAEVGFALVEEWKDKRALDAARAAGGPGTPAGWSYSFHVSMPGWGEPVVTGPRE